MDHLRVGYYEVTDAGCDFPDYQRIVDKPVFIVCKNRNGAPWCVFYRDGKQIFESNAYYAKSHYKVKKISAKKAGLK